MMFPTPDACPNEGRHEAERVFQKTPSMPSPIQEKRMTTLIDLRLSVEALWHESATGDLSKGTLSSDCLDVDTG